MREVCTDHWWIGPALPWGHEALDKSRIQGRSSICQEERMFGCLAEVVRTWAPRNRAKLSIQSKFHILISGIFTKGERDSNKISSNMFTLPQCSFGVTLSFCCEGLLWDTERLNKSVPRGPRACNGLNPEKKPTRELWLFLLRRTKMSSTIHLTYQVSGCQDRRRGKQKLMAVAERRYPGKRVCTVTCGWMPV